MKKVLFVGLFTLISVSAYAQAARPTDKFQWSIDAPSLAAAQGYRYELELDTVLLPTPLVTTCTGATTPYTCTAPIPPITPSNHVARVRAVDITDSLPLVGEWSDSLAFSMRATPAKPGRPTIVPGGN